MTDVGTFADFHIGETWKIYASLLDAAGQPLPTLDSGSQIEFLLGRREGVNGPFRRVLRIGTDDVYDANVGRIERVSAGLVKATVAPKIQTDKALDHYTGYTYQFWITLSNGERYLPVEGRLLLRAPI